MNKDDTAQKFDEELRSLWTEDLSEHEAKILMESVKYLGEVEPPRGLKQKLLSIPDERPGNLLSWLSLRGFSYALAPACALLLVILVVPRHEQQTIRVNAPAVVDDGDLQDTLADGSLFGALPDILDDDLSEMEDVL